MAAQPSNIVVHRVWQAQKEYVAEAIAAARCVFIQRAQSANESEYEK